jgi:TRAP-type C4-dicarboxylate transport system substrate-binding protein
MKKRALFGFIAVTLVVLFLGAWATVAPAASPEKIDIGFVHIWPATHMLNTEQFPRFFKKVEAATKGKYTLNIKYYPAGTLLGGADIYDGVAKGAVDAGSSVPSYTPGRFPVMLTLSQAGIAPPTSSDSAARIVWEFYKKFKPKEVEDVKVLYWYATGPGWLHSKTPVHKLEDIKGTDIRATGATAVALKALGANPVAMPQPEVYISAQKGIVKGSVAPIEVLQGYKQAEVFDYSTFVPFAYSEIFYTIMNWAKWKALPKDLQAAFDTVAEDAMKEAGQIWQHIQALGMEYAKKKPKGHEFIYLSKKEEARWIALLKPIRGERIAELNAKGFPGEEIVKEAGKITEKYNKQKYEPWKP